MTLIPPTLGRRVILHIGMPGTGTSALQAAFTLNRARLLDAGIRYPKHVSDKRASRGEAAAGNGSMLRAHLRPRATDDSTAAPAAIRRFLAQVEAAAEPTVLYSSEGLFHVDTTTNGVARLRQELASSGVALQVVALVRDVAGHAQTAYSQHVKGARLTTSFEDFIGSGNVTRKYVYAVQSNLNAYLSAVGPENMTVLHYDSHRTDLIDSVFTKVLGLGDDFKIEQSSRPVNRRLTAQELGMLRYLNRSASTLSAATRISDAIIAHPPYGEKYSSMRQVDLEHLSALYQTQVEWVNETFFDRRSTLSVRTAGITISDEAVEDAPLPEETRRVLGWLAHVAENSISRT